MFTCGNFMEFCEMYINNPITCDITYTFLINLRVLCSDYSNKDTCFA